MYLELGMIFTTLVVSIQSDPNITPQPQQIILQLVTGKIEIIDEPLLTSLSQK